MRFLSAAENEVRRAVHQDRVTARHLVQLLAAYKKANVLGKCTEAWTSWLRPLFIADSTPAPNITEKVKDKSEGNESKSYPKPRVGLPMWKQRLTELAASRRLSIKDLSVADIVTLIQTLHELKIVSDAVLVYQVALWPRLQRGLEAEAEWNLLTPHFIANIFSLLRTQLTTLSYSSLPTSDVTLRNELQQHVKTVELLWQWCLDHAPKVVRLFDDEQQILAGETMAKALCLAHNMVGVDDWLNNPHVTPTMAQALVGGLTVELGRQRYYQLHYRQFQQQSEEFSRKLHQFESLNVKLMKKLWQSYQAHGLYDLIVLSTKLLLQRTESEPTLRPPAPRSVELDTLSLANPFFLSIAVHACYEVKCLDVALRLWEILRQIIASDGRERQFSSEVLGYLQQALDGVMRVSLIMNKEPIERTSPPTSQSLQFVDSVFSFVSSTTPLKLSVENYAIRVHHLVALQRVDDALQTWSWLCSNSSAISSLAVASSSSSSLSSSSSPPFNFESSDVISAAADAKAEQLMAEQRSLISLAQLLLFAVMRYLPQWETTATTIIQQLQSVFHLSLSPENLDGVCALLLDWHSNAAVSSQSDIRARILRAMHLLCQHTEKLPRDSNHLLTLLTFAAEEGDVDLALRIMGWLFRCYPRQLVILPDSPWMQQARETLALLRRNALKTYIVPSPPTQPLRLIPYRPPPIQPRIAYFTLYTLLMRACLTARQYERIPRIASTILTEKIPVIDDTLADFFNHINLSDKAALSAVFKAFLVLANANQINFRAFVDLIHKRHLIECSLYSMLFRWAEEMGTTIPIRSISSDTEVVRIFPHVSPPSLLAEDNIIDEAFIERLVEEKVGDDDKEKFHVKEPYSVLDEVYAKAKLKNNIRKNGKKHQDEHEDENEEKDEDEDKEEEGKSFRKIGRLHTLAGLMNLTPIDDYSDPQVALLTESDFLPKLNITFHEVKRSYRLYQPSPETSQHESPLLALTSLVSVSEDMDEETKSNFYKVYVPGPAFELRQSANTLLALLVKAGEKPEHVFRLYKLMKKHRLPVRRSTLGLIFSAAKLRPSYANYLRSSPLLDELHALWMESPIAE